MQYWLFNAITPSMYLLELVGLLDGCPAPLTVVKTCFHTE